MNVKARMAAVITTVTITSAAITAPVVSDTDFSLMASHAIVSRYISVLLFKKLLVFSFLPRFCFVLFVCFDITCNNVSNDLEFLGRTDWTAL